MGFPKTSETQAKRSRLKRLLSVSKTTLQVVFVLESDATATDAVVTRSLDEKGMDLSHYRTLEVLLHSSFFSLFSTEDNFRTLQTVP